MRQTKSSFNGHWVRLSGNWVAALCCVVVLSTTAHGQSSIGEHATDLPDVIAATQPKMVKIFGAGGLNRLEAFQSGFLISSDGLLVTVWSYVLDSDVVTVILDDGRRFEAKLVGFHPQLEIALLKIDVTGQPHFNLDSAARASVGAQILAFSNLYGVATGNEQVSVQFGVVAATTSLEARRGAIETAYRGPVVILDAITSNPGSAGGAITDVGGRLVGLIGKELRSSRTNVWLNFAIPTEQLSVAIDEIQAGSAAMPTTPTQNPTESLTLRMLGITLVPNVVSRTPPFVDQVVPDSPAHRAGIQPDDLIMEIAGRLTSSREEVFQRLTEIDRDEAIEITVQRQKEFLKFVLRAN